MAAIFEYFQQYVQSGGAYGVVSQFSDGQIQNTAPATAKEPAAISSYVAALAADPTASRAMMAIATNSQLREAVASYHSEKSGYAWPYDGWRTEVGPLVNNLLASEPTGMRDLLTSVNGQINTLERQAAITSAAMVSSMTTSSAIASSSGNSSAIAGTATTNDGSGGLSEGAKIGIGVGVGVGVPILIAILVLIFIYCCRRGAGALRRGAEAGDGVPMAQAGSAMAGGAYAGNASSSAAATGAGAGAGLAGAGAAAGNSAAGSGSGYGAGSNGVNRSLAGNAASGGSNLASTSGTGAASGLGAGAGSGTGSGLTGLEAAGAGLAGGLGGYGASKLANGAGAGQNQAGTASAASGQDNLNAAAGASKLGAAGGAGSGQTGSAAAAGSQNNLNAATGTSSLASSGNAGAGVGSLNSGAGLDAAGAGLAGGLAGYGGSKLANGSGAGYNQTGTDSNASRTLDSASTNAGAGYGTSQATIGTGYGQSTANGNTTSGSNANATGRDIAGAGLAGGLAGYGASKLASGSGASQGQDGNTSTTGAQSYTTGGNTSQGSNAVGTGAAGHGTTKTSTNAGYGQSATNAAVGSGSGTGTTAGNGADSSTLRAADGTPLSELFAGAGAAALGVAGAAGLAGGAGVSNSFLISRIVIVSIEQDLNTVFLKTILSAQEYSWYTSGWYKIVTITNRRVIIIYSKQVETREVVLAEGQDVNSSLLQSKLSTQEYGWYSRGWYQVITINAQQIVIVFHKQVEIDLTQISRVLLSTQKDLNGAYFQSVLSRQEYEWYLHGWYIVITVDSQHWITVYNAKVQAREITLPSGQEATADYLHSVLSRWEYIWYLHGWFRIITSSSITKIHFINRLVRNAFGIFIYDAFGNNASETDGSSASQTANRSSLNQQGAITGGSSISRDAQDLNTSPSISRAADGLIMDRRRFSGETGQSAISRNAGRSYDAYPQNTSSSINRSAGGSTLDRRAIGSEVDQNAASRNLGQTHDVSSGQPTTSSSNTVDSTKLGQYGTAAGIGAGIGAGAAGLSKAAHSDVDGSVTPVRPSDNVTKKDGLDAGVVNRSLGDVAQGNTTSQSTTVSGLPEKSKKVLGIDKNADSVNLDAGNSTTGQTARGDVTGSNTGNPTTSSKALNTTGASAAGQTQTATASDSTTTDTGKKSSGIGGTLAGIAGGLGLGGLLGSKRNSKSLESKGAPKATNKDPTNDGSKDLVGSSTEQTKPIGQDFSASKLGFSGPLDSNASRSTWEENGIGWTRRDQEAQDMQTGNDNGTIVTGSELASAPRDIGEAGSTQRELASQPLTSSSSSAQNGPVLIGGVTDGSRTGLTHSTPSNVIGGSSTQQKTGELPYSGQINTTERDLTQAGNTPGHQDATRSTITGQNTSYGLPSTITQTSGKTEPSTIRAVQGTSSALDNSKSSLRTGYYSGFQRAGQSGEEVAAWRLSNDAAFDFYGRTHHGASTSLAPSTKQFVQSGLESGTSPNVTDISRSGLVYDVPAQEKIVQGSLQPSTSSRLPLQGTEFSSSSRAPSGVVPVLKSGDATARLDDHAPVTTQGTQSGLVSSSVIPAQSNPSKIPVQSTHLSSSTTPSGTTPLSKTNVTSAGLGTTQSTSSAAVPSTTRDISQNEPLSNSKDGVGLTEAERITLASSVPAALTDASAIAGSLASQKSASRQPEVTSASTTAAKAPIASGQDTTLKTSDKVITSPETETSSSRIPRAPGSGNVVSKFTESSKDISDTDPTPGPAPDRSESKKRLSGFGNALSRFGFGSKKSKDTPKKPEQTEDKPSSASTTKETKTASKPASVPTSTELTTQTTNGSTVKKGSVSPVPASSEIQRMDGSTGPSNVARVNALARETLHSGDANVKDTKQTTSSSTTGQGASLSPNTADTVNVEQGSLKRDIALGASQVTSSSVPASTSGPITDKVDSDRLKSTATRELEQAPETKNVPGVSSSTSTSYVTSQPQTTVPLHSNTTTERTTLRSPQDVSSSAGLTTSSETTTSRDNLQPAVQESLSGGNNVAVSQRTTVTSNGKVLPSTTQNTTGVSSSTQNFLSSPSSPQTVHSGNETSRSLVDPVPQAPSQAVSVPTTTSGAAKEYYQTGDAQSAPLTSTSTVPVPASSSTRETSSRVVPGAIAGGVLGGVAGLVAREIHQTGDARQAPETSSKTVHAPDSSSTREIQSQGAPAPVDGGIVRDYTKAGDVQDVGSASTDTANIPTTSSTHGTAISQDVSHVEPSQPQISKISQDPVAAIEPQGTLSGSSKAQVPLSTVLPEVPRTGGSLTDLEGQRTATSQSNVPTVGQSAQAQNTTEQIISSTAAGGDKPTSSTSSSNVSAPTGLDAVASTAQQTTSTQGTVPDSTRSLTQEKTTTWTPRDVQEDAAFGFYGKTQGIVHDGSSTLGGQYVTATPALVAGSSPPKTQDLLIGGTSRNVHEDAASGFYGKTQGVLPESSLSGISSAKSLEQPTSTADTSGKISSSIQPTGDSSSVVDNATLPGAFPGTASSTLPSTEGESATKSLLDQRSTSENVSATPINTSTNRESLANTVASLDTAGPWSPQSNTFSLPGDRSSASSEEESPESSTILGGSNRLSKSVLGAVGGAVGALGLTGIAKALAPEGSQEENTSASREQTEGTTTTAQDTDAQSKDTVTGQKATTIIPSDDKALVSEKTSVPETSKATSTQASEVSSGASKPLLVTSDELTSKSKVLSVESQKANVPEPTQKSTSIEETVTSQPTTVASTLIPDNSASQTTSSKLISDSKDVPVEPVSKDTSIPALQDISRDIVAVDSVKPTAGDSISRQVPEQQQSLTSVERTTLQDTTPEQSVSHATRDASATLPTTAPQPDKAVSSAVDTTPSANETSSTRPLTSTSSGLNKSTVPSTLSKDIPTTFSEQEKSTVPQSSTLEEQTAVTPATRDLPTTSSGTGNATPAEFDVAPSATDAFKQVQPSIVEGSAPIQPVTAAPVSLITPTQTSETSKIATSQPQTATASSQSTSSKTQPTALQQLTNPVADRSTPVTDGVSKEQKSSITDSGFATEATSSGSSKAPTALQQLTEPVKQTTTSSTAREPSSSKVNAPESVVESKTSTSGSRELPINTSSSVVTGTREADQPQSSTSSSILDTARNVVSGSASTSSQQTGSTTANVQDTVKQVSNQASAAIVGTAAAAASAAAVLGSKVLSSTDSNETENSTSSTSRTIAKEPASASTKETSNTSASILDTARETLGTASQQVANTVNNTATSARSAVESLGQNATTSSATEPTDTLTVDRSIAPQTQSTTTGLYEKVQDTANQASEQVSKTLSQTATATQDTAQSAVDSVSKASEQASKTLSQTATAAQDTAQSAVTSVNQTLTSPSTTLGTTTSSTERSIATGSEKPAESDTQSSTTGVVGQVQNIAGKASEQAQNVAGQASEQASKTLSQSTAAAQSTGQSVVDSARQTLQTAPTVDSTTTSTTERSVATGSGKPAKPQTQASTTGVIEQVQDTAGKTSEQVQTTAGQAYEQARTTTGQTTEQIQSTANKVYEQGQNAAVKTSEQAQAAAGQATEQAQNIAAQTFEQGQNAATKTSEQVQTTAGQAAKQVQSAADQTYEQGQNAATKTSNQIQNAAARTSEQLSSTPSQPINASPAVDGSAADRSITTESKDSTRTVLPEQAQGTLDKASEQVSTVLAGTTAAVASAVEAGKQYVPSSETVGLTPSSNDRSQLTGSKETSQKTLTGQARSVLNDVSENVSNAFGEVPQQASNALAGASSTVSSAIETGKQYVPSSETVTTAISGNDRGITTESESGKQYVPSSEPLNSATSSNDRSIVTGSGTGSQYVPSSATLNTATSTNDKTTTTEIKDTPQTSLTEQARKTLAQTSEKASKALAQVPEQASTVLAGSSSAVSSAAETGKQYIPSSETIGLAPSSTERSTVSESQETTQGSLREQAQGIVDQASEQTSSALTGASSVISSAAETGKQYVPSTESLGLTPAGTDRSIATGSNTTESVQQGNTSSGLFGLIQGAVEQVTHILPGAATTSGEKNTVQVPTTETSSSTTRVQGSATDATTDSRPSGSTTFAPKLTIVERPETASDSAGPARKKFSITHLESHGETIESGDLKDIFFDSPEAAQQHVDDLVSTHVSNASSSTEPQTMKLEHYESSGSGASGMTLWTMIKSGLGYGDSQTQQTLASKAIQEQVNTEGNIVKLEHYESTAPDQRGMTTWNVIPSEASGSQESRAIATAPKENIVVRGGEGSDTAISQGVRSGQHQGFSLKGQETIASGIEKQTETGKEVSSTDQPVIFKNGRIIIPGHTESDLSTKDTNSTSATKESATVSGPQEFSLTSRELVLPYHQEINDTFMQSILSSQEYSWYLSGFYKIFTTGGQKRIVINNRQVDSESSTREVGSDAIQQLASRVEKADDNVTSTTGIQRNITSGSQGNVDFEQLRQTLPADEFEKLKMTAITSAGQPSSTQQTTTSSSTSDHRTLNLTTPDGAHHELDVTGKTEAEIEQLVASYSQRFTSTTVTGSSSSNRRTLNLTLPDGKVEELDVTGKSDAEIEQLVASYTSRYTGSSITTSSSGSKEVSSSSNRRLLNLTLPNGEVKELDITGKSDKEIEELVASYDRRTLNLTLPDGTVKELDITGKSEQEIEDLVASYNRQTLNLTLPSGEVKELDITGKSEKEVEDLVASYNRRMLNLTLPSGEIKELDVTGKSEEEIQQLIASYSEQTTTTTTTSASGSSSKRILNLTLPDGQVKELDVTGKTDSQIEELVASYTKHTTTSTTGFSSSSSSHRTLNLTLPSGETKELDVTGKSESEIQQLIASYTTSSTTNLSYEQMVTQMREETEDEFESAETGEQQFFDTEEGQGSTVTKTVVSSGSHNFTDGRLPETFSGATTEEGEKKYVSDIGDFGESSSGGGSSLFG